MNAPSRPHRPAPRRLPRRVYWVRRLVLLAVLAVVVGTAYGAVQALAGAWSRAGAPDVATPASAELANDTDGAAEPGAAPSTGPSPTGSPEEADEEASGEGAEEAADRERETSRARRDRLPAPEGVCPDADVLVQPRVPEARLGEPIRIVLEVSTASTPACTWEVGPDSVFLKVTRVTEDAEGQVWSSQQCTDLMPTAQVVARREKPAEIVVSWSGRMSDPECSRLAGWVRAGSFRAVSVARGAVTPLEEDFIIEEAVPEIVVEPSPLPTDEPGERSDAEEGEEASESSSESSSEQR